MIRVRQITDHLNASQLVKIIPRILTEPVKMIPTMTYHPDTRSNYGVFMELVVHKMLIDLKKMTDGPWASLKATRSDLTTPLDHGSYRDSSKYLWQLMDQP